MATIRSEIKGYCAKLKSAKTIIYRAPTSAAEPDRLEVAADQAIAACGGPVPRNRKDRYYRVGVRPWPGLRISLRCRSMLLTENVVVGEPIECPSPATAIELRHASQPH
jgi:hypothetical protein